MFLVDKVRKLFHSGKCPKSPQKISKTPRVHSAPHDQIYLLTTRQSWCLKCRPADTNRAAQRSSNLQNRTRPGSHITRNHWLYQHLCAFLSEGLRALHTSSSFDRKRGTWVVPLDHHKSSSSRPTTLQSLPQHSARPFSVDVTIRTHTVGPRPNLQSKNSLDPLFARDILKQDPTVCKCPDLFDQGPYLEYSWACLYRCRPISPTVF